MLEKKGMKRPENIAMETPLHMMYGMKESILLEIIILKVSLTSRLNDEAYGGG